MNEQTIKAMLDQLDEFQSQRDTIGLHKLEAIDKVITPEIKSQLDAIDIEFGQMSEAVDANIASLTTAVKAAVAEYGASVKGGHLQAVYAKGRVSWDTKGLDGYLVAHPEIAAFRSQGEPSVSIRGVK